MSGKNAITLNINLNVAENAINSGALQGLEACGIQIENYTRTNITNNGSVDTGLLRNSIAHVVPKSKNDDLRVYVGTNVYYAPYVEMGHRQNVGQYVPKLGKRLVAPFVKAKPFLRPAFTEHIQEFKDILSMYIAQSAEDVNNK